MGNFWKNKRVVVTGHTGFKGSWLCLWLYLLGAKISGYALQPPTHPSLFKLCKVDKLLHNSVIGDIRDLKKLKTVMLKAAPEIVIHMAAQPLVRDSYKNPVDTYAVNVMGTVNLFESVRSCKTVRAVLNVTTDKCYANENKKLSFRENEPLGGHDPYSSSKACSEIVTAAYRDSFFHTGDTSSQIGVATVRAGNVIGGGDWATDRLVPDFIRAILSNRKIAIRNPKAVRPWQYVLEPLSGYLILAEKLYKSEKKYSGAWNFGPDEKDTKCVEWIVKRLCQKWGETAAYEADNGKHPYEAHHLMLNCYKAQKGLGWYPKYSLDKTLDEIVYWTRAYQGKKDLLEICLKQINNYINEK